LAPAELQGFVGYRSKERCSNLFIALVKHGAADMIELLWKYLFADDSSDMPRGGTLA
jgi:hypothetical protein